MWMAGRAEKATEDVSLEERSQGVGGGSQDEVREDF